MLIGQTIDHYRIESKLGEGGMGVVYKAHDTHLDRKVAIKVLPPDKVADAGRNQRFVQEAKAASALNHSNIVTIHDIRSDAGTAFIVMEYIGGQTLGGLIRLQALRQGQTLRFAVQIADALAKAHEAGILHRDLKPSNVMVTDEGRVKILDFGLAKLMEPAVSSPDSSTVTALPMTEEGVILGTVAYMSPEQAEGRKLDPRSDIFSFGSVLYEMATGRAPFTADSRVSMLIKVVTEDPKPPSQIAGSIAPELEKIILRCLRKDPARRYQTMADLKVALEDVEQESASKQRPGAERTRRPGAWVAALLLPLLLAAGFFAWQAWRKTQIAGPMRAVSLTTLPGAELYPSFSPDGNYVAFSWNGPKQDNPDIYVQMIGTGSPLRLTTDPRTDSDPVWSPDGRWIAFLRGEVLGPLSTHTRELRLIPPLGGPERKLAEVRTQEVSLFPTYLAWCPDSNCLVVADSLGEGKPDALFVVSINSGEKKQLTSPQPPVLADSSPAVSPDGGSLIFRRLTAWAQGDLYLLPLGRGLTAAGKPRRIRTEVPAASNTGAISALSAEHPAWMPGGKEIIFAARGSLWRLDIPGENPPARIPFVGEDGLMPAVSRPQPGRPARLGYVRSFNDENIWRVETSAPGAPASSRPVVFIASSRWDSQPQLSPDGRHIAFASDRSGAWEIWQADPDGSNAVQLTSMGAQATGTGAPNWSPDSQQIVFASDVEGQFEIYVISAAGGRPRRLTSDPALDHGPRFSRDGKWIYFNSQRTGEYRIWKMPAAGGDAVQVTHDTGFVAGESPDGAYLYYTGSSIAGSPLWRVSLSGGQPVKVLDGVVWWNVVMLDRGIYYVDRPAAEARLQFFDFATRKSTTVARDLGDVSGGLTASPDGRTILYARVDSSLIDLMLVENFR